MAKIGLLSALKWELPQAIPYGKSKCIQTHKLGDYDVGVLVSGVGYKRAEQAAERLCIEFNPDYVMCLGVCGGVGQKVNIGTLVVANKVHYHGETESLECPELEGIQRCLAESSIDWKVGGFQTFDTPVLSKAEVLEDVLGVDMEAFAVVKKAREYHVPSVIIKSVSDILPEKAPLMFPELRLLYCISRNFKAAKKGLDDFGQAYF